MGRIDMEELFCDVASSIAPVPEPYCLMEINGLIKSSGGAGCRGATAGSGSGTWRAHGESNPAYQDENLVSCPIDDGRPG